ncbi:hypothetical protein KAR91_28135 [Candidatus Pacearchaeota archaeon]|nr:hypothetical protein [Candidatus Pacearchaeota archaeon]
MDPREEIKTIDDARAKCHILDMHCPTLDDNMRPKPELLNMKCPSDLDGQCASCDRFVGFKPGDDGTIFAHMKIEGWCLKDFVQKIKGDQK